MKTFVGVTPLQFFAANGVASTSMAATLNSKPFMVQSVDRICFQLNAANSAAGGVPAGTYALQASLDYAQKPDGTVLNAGTFTSLSLAGSTTIAAAGTTLINVDAFAFVWARIQWVPTSGDGILTGFFAGRQI